MLIVGFKFKWQWACVRTLRCESILHIVRRIVHAWTKIVGLSRYSCINSANISTLALTAKTALHVLRCLQRLCSTFSADLRRSMCEVLRLHARTSRSTLCTASSSTTFLQQIVDQRVVVSVHRIPRRARKDTKTYYKRAVRITLMDPSANRGLAGTHPESQWLE